MRVKSRGRGAPSSCASSAPSAPRGPRDFPPVHTGSKRSLQCDYCPPRPPPRWEEGGLRVGSCSRPGSGRGAPGGGSNSLRRRVCVCVCLCVSVLCVCMCEWGRPVPIDVRRLLCRSRTSSLGRQPRFSILSILFLPSINTRKEGTAASPLISCRANTVVGGRPRSERLIARVATVTTLGGGDGD